MKIQIAAILLGITLTTGCAQKNYHLGQEPEMASACGESVEVAIEGAPQMADADCGELQKQASKGNNGTSMLLQVLGYVAGYAIGASLF